LIVSSEYSASGVVELPRLGSTIAFTVQPNVATSIDIPASMDNLPGGNKSNYGIRVTSDFPISLYGLNQVNNSTDAFLVLPIHSLGKEYMAVTYNSFDTSYPSHIAIVGVQDNTQIKITSPVATTTAPAGTERIIT